MEKMFKATKDNGMEFAPLRSLGDFILESARFQLPNFKDLDKWGYRVTNNLLYYQSNYFLMSLLVFAIIGALHPVKMVYGLVIITILILIFWYITNENPMASDFKKNHPIVSILLVLGGLYLVMNMLDSILVFFIGIMFPLSAIFIHSSLRLRSVKNKLVNQAENYKLTQTPMGFFLKELGLRTDVF